MSKGITSTEGLIRKVFSITRATDEILFYRGHSNKDKYKLEPSLYRSPQLLKSENLLYNELIAANPSDFSSDMSTFEKLVRMQHYSLPTRLLDITSNPLMSLFFACKSNYYKIGEVIVFKIRDSYIKFFDSDTAFCLSNLGIPLKSATHSAGKSAGHSADVGHPLSGVPPGKKLTSHKFSGESIFERSLRIDSPFSSTLYALCSTRSRIASAMVGSFTAPCQLATGY